MWTQILLRQIIQGPESLWGFYLYYSCIFLLKQTTHEKDCTFQAVTSSIGKIYNSHKDKSGHTLSHIPL